MPSGVTNAVRINLTGAEPVKETLRKTTGDGRAGASIMCMPDRLRSMAGGDLLEAVTDDRDGFFPTNRLVLVAAFGTDAQKRLSQPGLRIEIGAVISDGAFTAESPAADVVVGITQHLYAAIGRFNDGYAASVVTIAWTGRSNDRFVGHDPPILAEKAPNVNEARTP